MDELFQRQENERQENREEDKKEKEEDKKEKGENWDRLSRPFSLSSIFLSFIFLSSGFPYQRRMVVAQVRPAPKPLSRRFWPRRTRPAW
jgi:hypothetical protein